MSWLKNLGDTVWKATKSVVANPVVQSAAGMFGLGGVADMANDFLNPEKTATQIVQPAPVVQTVAQVVTEPARVTSAVKQEIVTAERNVSGATGRDYMPFMIAGGLGLAAIMILRK